MPRVPTLTLHRYCVRVCECCHVEFGVWNHRQQRNDCLSQFWQLFYRGKLCKYLVFHYCIATGLTPSYLFIGHNGDNNRCYFWLSRCSCEPFQTYHDLGRTALPILVLTVFRLILRRFIVHSSCDRVACPLELPPHSQQLLLVRWFIIGEGGGRAWVSMHCWYNVLSWHENHG